MAVYKVIFSPTGGTKRVADLLAEGWSGVQDPIDLTLPGTFGQQFTQEDLCLFAIPVFEGRVPKVALERVKTMSGNGAAAIAVAVYGGRAVDDALLELADTLEELGFVCGAGIAAVAEHSILHIYAQGRPDPQDVESLHQMSAKLRALWEKGALPKKVTVPGKRPYIRMGGSLVVPKGDDRCVQCGQCAQGCPVQAISGPDFSLTDGAKCILCMRCIAGCPTHARDLDPNLVKAVQIKMAPAFAGERHNQLFLDEA